MAFAHIGLSCKLVIFYYFLAVRILFFPEKEEIYWLSISVEYLTHTTMRKPLALCTVNKCNMRLL